MDKLSPHYRNDTAGGLDPLTSGYLDTHYFSQLKNLKHKNPKLLVVFSGGNAMGKTTIARKIEAELHGLVLENDAVKRQLLKLMPDIGRDRLNQLTWEYMMGLYERLGQITPNGLVVRDGVIDWYFDRILPVFEKAGYPLFVIGFDVSRDKAIELIKQRGDTPTVKSERLYKLLDDHKIHIPRFRKQHTPDIVLSDDNLFDHEAVLEKLKQRLREKA